MDWLLVLAVVVTLVAIVYGPLVYAADGYCFDDAPVPRMFADWRTVPWSRFLRDQVGSPQATWHVVLRVGLSMWGASRRSWIIAALGVHVVNALLLAAVARTLGASMAQSTAAAAVLVAHPMAVPGVVILGGTASALVLSGILVGLLAVLHDALVATIAVGLVTSFVKVDGWAYWPHIAIAYGVLR